MNAAKRIIALVTVAVAFVLLTSLFIGPSEPETSLPTQMVLPSLPAAAVEEAPTLPVIAVADAVTEVAQQPTATEADTETPTFTAQPSNTVTNTPYVTQLAPTAAPVAEAIPIIEVPELNPNTPEPVLPVINVPAEPVQDQVVLSFEPDTSAEERAAYLESIGAEVVQDIDGLNSVVLKVPAGVDNPLLMDMTFATSQSDYYVVAQNDPAPVNDPRYLEQWGLPAINAPAGWSEMPADAPSVTVAVIDSGICAGHPDLVGRVLPGYDFIEDDTTPQDDFGHGCGVAGIIAANTNNALGIAGVAPNALIMPLRVLDAQGIGTYSDVAAALVYAADNGAQVVNLSLGGLYSSAILENAIDYAVAKGVTVVAAAGNTGGSVLYPAAYEPVISVGSVDRDLTISSFSSGGGNVDLLAPGRDVLTTQTDGSYGYMSGTSFAAPHVSAALAHGNVTQDGSIIDLQSTSSVPKITPTIDADPIIVPMPDPVIDETIRLDNLISPDGRHKVYVTADNISMDNATIWIETVGTGLSVPLVTSGDNYWVSSPVWSPDSNTVAYIKFVEKGVLPYEVDISYELWRIDIDGTKHHPLRQDIETEISSGWQTNIQWKPEGITYTDTHAGVVDVYLLNPDTLEAQITNTINLMYPLAQPANVPYFSQRDPRWGRDTIGQGTCTDPTIENWGCAITSVSMVLRYYGAYIDPGMLNDWLNENDGYSGCSLYFTQVKEYPGVNLDYDRIDRFDPQVVKSELDAGYPVILRVNNGGHFVVATHYEGDVFYINDPLSSDIDTLKEYNNTFDSIRIFRGKTPGQISGRVLNPSRQPLANAGVYAKVGDTPVGIATVTTDSDGYYTLENIPAGTVTIEAGHSQWGIGNVSVNVTGNPDQVATDIVMGVCVAGLGDASAMNTSCGDTTPPTGGFTAPVDGASVGTSVTLSGEASDASGIREVRFTAWWEGQDDQNWPLLHTDTTYPYSYNWDLCAWGVPNGSVLIGFDITDNNGNIAKSPGGTRTIYKTVSCAGDPPPPTEETPTAKVELHQYANYEGGIVYSQGLGFSNGPSANSYASHSIFIPSGWSVQTWRGDDRSGGESRCWSESHHNLTDHTWNNAIESMEVFDYNACPQPPPDDVILCTSDDANSGCYIFGLGIYELGSTDLNDQIRSVQSVPSGWSVKLFRESEMRGTAECYEGPRVPLPAGHPWDLVGQVTTVQVFDQAGCPSSSLGSVVLYDSQNYSGHRWGMGYKQGLFNTGSVGGATEYFNDRAESVRIPSGWSVKLYSSDNGYGTPSGCLTGDVPTLDGLNNSVSSVEIFHNTSCQPPIPGVPQELRGASASSDSVTLAWNDVQYESGYKIYRWGAQNDVWDFYYLDSVGADVTTFTDSGINCDYGNLYQISAYNSSGESNRTGWIEARTAACPAPSTPGNFRVSATAERSITLAWDDVSSESGYKLYQWNGTAFSYYTSVGTNETTYTFSGLACDTEYRFKLSAYNGVGESALTTELIGSTDACSDTEPPTAAITYPLDNAILSDNVITITANADDVGSGVSAVQFYAWYDDLSGLSVQQTAEIGAPPPSGSPGNSMAAQGIGWHEIGWDSDGSDGWSLVWDVTGMTEQTVGLWIYAYDSLGNYAAHSVNNIYLDRTPIIVVEDEYRVVVDNELLVEAASGLLINDSGADFLTASLVREPHSGTLSLYSDGSFRYMPDPGLYGVIDTFTYKASDGVTYSALGTVTIYIDGTTTTCSTVTEIPPLECDALLTLYESTDGTNWTNNTDWGLTQSPCSWFGVTCENGHVVGLNLTAPVFSGYQGNNLTGQIPPQIANLSALRGLTLYKNNLSGTIPVELGSLTNLATLDLAYNQLSGSIPESIFGLTNLGVLDLSGNQLTGGISETIGNLTNLRKLALSSNQLSGIIPSTITSLVNLSDGAFPSMDYTSIGYNLLQSDDPVVMAFLDEKQADWADTQTIAPVDVQTSEVTENSVLVSWTPITYTANGGYYEVGYSTDPGGPYTVAGQTADKVTGSLSVTGLTPDTMYYFVVHTFTPAHASNQNALTSMWSDEIIATTRSEATNTPTFTPTMTTEPTATPTITPTSTSTMTPTVEPTNTPTVTTEPSSTPTPTLGDTLNWIAPTGITQTIGNPIYQWTQVAGATAYEIYVGPANVYIPANFFGTVSASVCTNGICSVDLTKQISTIPGAIGWLLSPGSYDVFINPEPGNLTTWNGPFTFTATALQPNVPTIVEPSGLDASRPTLNWVLEGNATGAAFFQLYLAPTDDLLNTALPLPTWVTREQVCGRWDGTNCSYTVPNALQSSTEYALYMQSWGMAGMSTGGLGGAADGWVEYIFTTQ